MNLENLTKNQCPKCGEYLQWDKEENLYCVCGFRVDSRRANKWIVGIVEKKIEDKYS